MSDHNHAGESHGGHAHGGHAHGGQAHAGHEHGEAGHVVPWQLLLAVCLALLVLTWLTVAATWVNLGTLNLWIAMVVATVKAGLVVLYFMHLRYDKPFNAVLLGASLLFVLLFIGLALTDTVAYRDEIIWEQAELNPRATP